MIDRPIDHKHPSQRILRYAAITRLRSAVCFFVFFLSLTFFSSLRLEVLHALSKQPEAVRTANFLRMTTDRSRISYETNSFAIVSREIAIYSRYFYTIFQRTHLWIRNTYRTKKAINIFSAKTFFVTYLLTCLEKKLRLLIWESFYRVLIKFISHVV